MSFSSKMKRLTLAFAAVAAVYCGSGAANAADLSSPLNPMNPLSPVNPYHLMQQNGSSPDNAAQTDSAPMTAKDWLVIAGVPVAILSGALSLFALANRYDGQNAKRKPAKRDGASI